MFTPTQIVNPPVVQGLVLVLLSVFAGYFQKDAITEKVLNSHIKYVILFGLLYFSVNFSRGIESPNEQLLETVYLFILFLMFEQLPPQLMGIVLVGFFVLLYIDNWVAYHERINTASTPREHVVHEKTIQQWKTKKQYITYAVLTVLVSGVVYRHRRYLM